MILLIGKNIVHQCHILLFLLCVENIVYNRLQVTSKCIWKPFQSSVLSLFFFCLHENVSNFLQLFILHSLYSKLAVMFGCRTVAFGVKDIKSFFNLNANSDSISGKFCNNSLNQVKERQHDFRRLK